MITADDLSPLSSPEVAGVPPSASATPLPWLKPLVAAAVLIFALLSLLELAAAFAVRLMPALHYIAGPIAIGLIVVTWFAELGGLRWSCLVFVAVVTAPNLVLAAIGHGQLNFLFLTLTVAWAAYRGSRTAGRVALALNLAVVGVAALADLAQGQFALAARIPWAVGLILAWWATRALVFQQRLTAELRATQHDLAQRAAENERLHAAAERRLRDVEALYRADAALYGALRTAQVLQALVDVVSDVVAADQSAALTWDAGGDRLVVVAARGWDADALARLSAALEDGVTGQVFRGRRLLAIADAGAAEKPGILVPPAAVAGVRSLLVAPILGDDADERVAGVLLAGYHHSRSFSDEEQRLFMALAVAWRAFCLQSWRISCRRLRRGCSC